MYPSYRLDLGGGFDLQITAAGAEASSVVNLLAGAMKLQPGDGNYSLLVLTGQESVTVTVDGKRIVCGFPSPKEQEDVAIQAMQVGLAIAHEVQKRGGILVHGGLAELHGRGVILAAPGGTGKTTASTRLPAPWHSLCDDMALICRDADGRYYAHPWPSWSRFYFNGTGGSWDTASRIPLKAIYFLSQSPDDHIATLNPSHAAAMLIESVEQANRVFDLMLSISDIHHNHHHQFSIVCELSACLPMYRLQLSLTGKFWNLIEASLEHSHPVEKLSGVEGEEGSEVSIKEQSDLCEVVLTGTSMYPTLKEPGFLDVRPYGQAKPRRGDVICFRSSESGKMVVHRVMTVRQDGLITRGDNIPHNDPEVVTFSAVTGRVDAIRKGDDKTRQVRSGMMGMLDYLYGRLFRRTRILVGRICHLIPLSDFLSGCLRFFVPRSSRFKFVYFGSMPLGRLKILSGKACIGHYLRGCWHISFPWRFLIDSAKTQSASQQFESAEAQWLNTHIDVRMQASAVHEHDVWNHSERPQVTR